MLLVLVPILAQTQAWIHTRHRYYKMITLNGEVLVSTTNMMQWDTIRNETERVFRGVNWLSVSCELY